jgi:GAF domain-containing protein
VIDPDDDGVAVRPAVDELTRARFAEMSLEALLERVSDLAGRVLPGRPVTSVTVLGRGRPVTAAASGELAAGLDEVQYRLGDGPCMSAATTGRPMAVPDTDRPEQWPEFARAAAERECSAVLSIPLPIRDGLSGALNVYAPRFSLVDGTTRRLAEAFGSRAAVVVANMYLYDSARERADHLQTALDSRAVIDQAKGILMERFKLTPDQAFAALTRVSMETNTKVRDVADHLVASGELFSR